MEVQTKQTCAALDGSSTEMKQGTEHQSLVGVRVCVCASLWLCLCATSVDGPTLPSSSSSLSGSVIEMPEIPGTT